MAQPRRGVSSRDSAAAFDVGAEAVLGFRSMTLRAWAREAWLRPWRGDNRHPWGHLISNRPSSGRSLREK